MSKHIDRHRNLTHSQKLTVCLTPDQYVELAKRAMLEECSMGWLVRTAVTEYMLAHSFAPKSPKRHISVNTEEQKL